MQVARSQEQVFVQLTGDDQQSSRAMSFSFCASSLVFGASKRTSRQRSDDPDVPVRTGCFQRAAVHLLVNFLTVVLRTSRKVTPPERQIGLLIEPERARRCLSGATVFYRNQLLQHESSSTSTLTSTSCISNNNLVNQRSLKSRPKVVSETVSALCASSILIPLLSPYAFTAGLTIRSYRLHPGQHL